MHSDVGEDDRNVNRSSLSIFNWIADRLRLVTFCDVVACCELIAFRGDQMTDARAIEFEPIRC